MGNAHVLTVGMRDDMMPTEGQPQEEKHQWAHHVQAPQNGNACNNADDFAGEDHGIAKGFTNGNVAVKGHGHQHNALHNSEEVDEEHLGKAAFKRYVPEVEPENPQHFGDGGCGQAQVDGVQHGQEVVHGLMETMLSPDHEQDSSIPQEGNKIHKEKGESNPDMHVL